MSTREAFIEALRAEPPLGVNLEWIADDLDEGTEISDARDDIAHSLWRMGVFLDHIGECIADEDHSIYTNECAPCQEQYLAIADRVRSRLMLGSGGSE